MTADPDDALRKGKWLNGFLNSSVFYDVREAGVRERVCGRESENRRVKKFKLTSIKAHKNLLLVLSYLSDSFFVFFFSREHKR